MRRTGRRTPKGADDAGVRKAAGNGARPLRLMPGQMKAVAVEMATAARRATNQMQSVPSAVRGAMCNR